MALADDLKSLEELHAKGKLSDQEFAIAKAAAINQASGTSAAAPKPALQPAPKLEKKSPSLRRIALGLLLIILVWIYVQSNLNKPASTVLTEITHMPSDLRTETFTVPARSWKAIGIQVPYSGSLTVNAQVQNGGNAMEMFLTDDAGLEKLKASGQSTYFGGFYAVKGASFQHTERMNTGSYYFIVRDRHFGVFSASASDVTLKARIDP